MKDFLDPWIEKSREQKLADDEKSKELFAIFTPAIVERLSDHLYIGNLFRNELDIYERYENFLNNPNNYFFKKSTQKCFVTFNQTFSNLTEFTSNEFCPNERRPNLLFQLIRHHNAQYYYDEKLKALQGLVGKFQKDYKNLVRSTRKKYIGWQIVTISIIMIIAISALSILYTKSESNKVVRLNKSLNKNIEDILPPDFVGEFKNLSTSDYENKIMEANLDNRFTLLNKHLQAADYVLSLFDFINPMRNESEKQKIDSNEKVSMMRKTTEHLKDDGWGAEASSDITLWADALSEYSFLVAKFRDSSCGKDGDTACAEGGLSDIEKYINDQYAGAYSKTSIEILLAEMQILTASMKKVGEIGLIDFKTYLSATEEMVGKKLTKDEINKLKKQFESNRNTDAQHTVIHCCDSFTYSP